MATLFTVLAVEGSTVCNSDICASSEFLTKHMVINKLLLKLLLTLQQQPAVGILIIDQLHGFQTIVVACTFITEMNVRNESLGVYIC